MGCERPSPMLRFRSSLPEVSLNSYHSTQAPSDSQRVKRQTSSYGNPAINKNDIKKRVHSVNEHARRARLKVGLERLAKLAPCTHAKQSKENTLTDAIAYIERFQTFERALKETVNNIDDPLADTIKNLHMQSMRAEKHRHHVQTPPPSNSSSPRRDMSLDTDDDDGTDGYVVV
ncbi:MAG: hypothetical protein M1827_005404 [Pycnora praestabilis]|nr:MAG: hypothetical protein M1827_005404 [Pycnora praestabilis]